MSLVYCLICFARIQVQVGSASLHFSKSSICFHHGIMVMDVCSEISFQKACTNSRGKPHSHWGLSSQQTPWRRRVMRGAADFQSASFNWSAASHSSYMCRVKLLPFVQFDSIEEVIECRCYSSLIVTCVPVIWILERDLKDLVTPLSYGQ